MTIKSCHGLNQDQSPIPWPWERWDLKVLGVAALRVILEERGAGKLWVPIQAGRTSTNVINDFTWIYIVLNDWNIEFIQVIWFDLVWKWLHVFLLRRNVYIPNHNPYGVEIFVFKIDTSGLTKRWPIQYPAYAHPPHIFHRFDLLLILLLPSDKRERVWVSVLSFVLRSSPWKHWKTLYDQPPLALWHPILPT